MGGAEQVRKRSGLRKGVLTEITAGGQHLVHGGRELVLHPLRLVRSRDAQTDGREEQPAQRQREQELLRMGALDAESAQHGPRDWRVVQQKPRGARAVAYAPDFGRKDARPWVRLARFATRLTRNASARASRRGRAVESACAAEASGSVACPACQSASCRKRRSSAAVRTSPCCAAASSPPECAKPPVGSAESESCSKSQESFIGKKGLCAQGNMGETL